jgi:4-hydroxythreonine-4-phosphate dehydrogenase
VRAEPGLRIGITLGDPRGVGPEVAAAAARALAGPDRPHLTFIGPSGTGAEVEADAFEPVGAWPAAGAPALAGRLAGEAIVHAAGRALAGAFDALVTAPVDKAALHAGGFETPGHTELLATLTGAADVAMLMCAERTALGGPLRVVLATTHVPLRAVADLVTAERLAGQTRLLNTALRDDWGIACPRLALCALNPHASDGGRFGEEEARTYVPALRVLRDEGLDVTGPVPADTVFVRAIRGAFDGVVAPYHDVGMAAFKTAAFGQGVNVTLGLPFVRTSPDHGTAVDLAGTGRADAASMIEALRLAIRLVRARRAVLAR